MPFFRRRKAAKAAKAAAGSVSPVAAMAGAGGLGSAPDTTPPRLSVEVGVIFGRRPPGKLAGVMPAEMEDVRHRGTTP